MKLFIYLGAAVGGLIGGYLPVMFGNSDLLSTWSIVGSVIGTLIGIWVGYRAGQYFDI